MNEYEKAKIVDAAILSAVNSELNFKTKLLMRELSAKAGQSTKARLYDLINQGKGDVSDEG